MNFYPLYIPMAVMMSLTLLVWLYMYVRRLSYVIKHNIHADELYAPEKVARLLPDSVNAASNNLKNLFEMPVLFYITILMAAQIHDHSIVSNLAAWSFVVLRITHSVIHCGNGRVMPRFVCYLLSCLALTTLMLNVFWQVFVS